MKKLLLSSVALVGFTAGAMAADLPRRAAPPAYFAPVPVFTWTGFYVGVNAGYGWSSDDNNDCLGCFGGGVVTVDTTPGGATVAPLALPSGALLTGNNIGGGGNRDGFVGGAQVGFNYQFTPGSGFVVGVEADIQWLGGDNDKNNGFFGNNLFNHAPVAPFLTPGAGIVGVPATGSNVALFNQGGLGNSNNGNDWFATARVRVGYAFDRVLVYATGGLAFTDNGNNNNGFFGVTNGSQLPAAFYVSPAAAVFGSTVGTGGFFGKNNNNDVGWVLGGGVEYAFTNNLTVKLEGLWVSMDNNNNNNNFGFGNGIIGVSNTGAPIRSNAFFGGNNNNDNEFFVARVGLNYKFGL